MRAMNDTLVTVGTTLLSGVVAAGLALAADRWRSDRARRIAGREALQEFQRTLVDWSSYTVITDVGLEEHPLEKVSLRDVAAARRAAYPYRDLLARNDQVLVKRNSVPFDPYSDHPVDARQPAINQWATDLHEAIERAFSRRLWRRRRRT